MVKLITKKLIQQVENSKPDVAIDVEIWLAMVADMEVVWSVTGMAAQRPLFSEDRLINYVRRSPSEGGFVKQFHSYGASIDRALTLLPKGALWSVCDMEEGPYAQIIRPMPCGGYVGGLTTAKGRTAAMAICAAMLKASALSVNARATTETE